MVDPARVRRLLTALKDYRDLLEKLSDLGPERYVSEQAFAGRYLVQAAAQVCIDIANHLISSEGWRVPADFRDAFTVLSERDVIEDDLADRMRALTGMRNRLVHLYEDVDDSLVFRSLAEGIEDLDAFAQAVARMVDGQDDS